MDDGCSFGETDLDAAENVEGSSTQRTFTYPVSWNRCIITKRLMFRWHLHWQPFLYRLCRLGCPSVDIVGNSPPSFRIPVTNNSTCIVFLYREDNTSHSSFGMWPRSWRFPCCWSRTYRRLPAAVQGCHCPPPGTAGTLGSKTVNIRIIVFVNCALLVFDDSICLIDHRGGGTTIAESNNMPVMISLKENPQCWLGLLWGGLVYY